mmetsp:Transcript_128941/g.223673  ORF Transcript_128941/g.223673 Transcript_128941/m.223673 type:complete len:655 (-) Transcript_128941:53-2017(-)
MAISPRSMSPDVVSTSAQLALADIAALFEDPAWAEVYAACCCDTGETMGLEQARSFRDAVMAQNPGNHPERLTLRCLRVGATAVSCLALQMKDRGYTRVDLSDNQLGDHAVLAARSLIRALPKLQWLGIASNLIGPDGARELAEELEINRMLEGLVLGGNESEFHGARPNSIGAEGLRAILEAVQRNPHPALTSLTLCNTALSAEAGRHLAGFLESNDMLQHLDLSSNPLSSEGVCALLPQCSRLRVLNIADTGCRGELIHSQLCAMLQKASGLVHLSLAQNPLETRPFRRISRALASCESLVSLDLECTSLDTEGVTVLADALLAAPVQSLTELDLSDNGLSQVEAAAALAHTIANSVLQVLRLNRNALGDAGIRELADALDSDVCPSSSLQHLEIGSCRVGTAGAGHLFSCLARNETLRVLRVGDNFLDGALDIGLIERLTHVTELHLAGNRLSHNSLQRAAQTCARNRQRARDEGPFALRAEMHRLLFQETKRTQARKQVAEDEAEIETRQCATQHAQFELRQLRATEAEKRHKLMNQIELEKKLLEESKAELVRINAELIEKTAHYENLSEELQNKCQQREGELTELQGLCAGVEQEMENRKVEHPQQVMAVRAQIRMARADAEQLDQNARKMEKQVQALSEKSLIDLKP